MVDGGDVPIRSLVEKSYLVNSVLILQCMDDEAEMPSPTSKINKNLMKVSNRNFISQITGNRIFRIDL